MSSAELYVVPVYDILILLPKSVRKHRSAGRSGMDVWDPWTVHTK